MLQGVEVNDKVGAAQDGPDDERLPVSGRKHRNLILYSGVNGGRCRAHEQDDEPENELGRYSQNILQHSYDHS